MLIPKSFKIGRRRYNVRTVPDSRRYAGLIVPEAKAISIMQRYKGKPRSAEQQAGTFWHEVTHAVLYEMDHVLWGNEKFVTEFSTRLHQVMQTAELGA